MKMHLKIAVRLALTATAAIAANAHAAAGNATHAMVVSGQAFGTGTFACATSGPQARELAFFNSGIPLPSEGYAACHLAGGIDNQSSTTGGVNSFQAVNGSFNGGISNLQAAARASQTSLGVTSKGLYTGSSDAFTYRFAEAAAYTSDSIPLPGSGAGTIQLGFTIDGSSSSVGSSQTLVFLNYQFGAGPIYNVFVGETGPNNRAVNPLLGAVPGFTVAGTSLSGSGVVPTFAFDVQLGANFDYNLGLYAASYPGSFIGTADNDFFSTARLTSIVLRDASGAPLTFSVVGASGTIYDNNGAHAPAVGGVPEPASWVLLIAGFGIVGAAARRRRTAKTLGQHHLIAAGALRPVQR